MKRVKFTVEKTNTGFSAFAEAYPVYTTGENMVELRANILDAINSWFEHKNQPLINENNIEISLDLPQFFDYYKEINAKAISKRIGMNESLLSQYVTGVKKPSEKQKIRILSGIRELGIELMSLEFA